VLSSVVIAMLRDVITIVGMQKMYEIWISIVAVLCNKCRHHAGYRLKILIKTVGYYSGAHFAIRF